MRAPVRTTRGALALELMLDALFIVLSTLFFMIATAYVRGCERLLPRNTRPAPHLQNGEESAS